MGRGGGPEAEVAGLEAVVELDVEADPVLHEQPLRPAQYPELLPREPTARKGLSRDASVWWEVDEEPGVCVCVRGMNKSGNGACSCDGGFSLGKMYREY